VSTYYDWMKFYEAAVLETDPKTLPRCIEVAHGAIGKRVMSTRVDDYERGAITSALDALAVLQRERCASENRICHQER
jgi:hypothetical protein